MFARKLSLWPCHVSVCQNTLLHMGRRLSTRGLMLKGAKLFGIYTAGRAASIHTRIFPLFVLLLQELMHAEAKHVSSAKIDNWSKHIISMIPLILNENFA